LRRKKRLFVSSFIFFFDLDHFVETRSHIKEENFKKAMDIMSYYFHLSKEILEDLKDEEKNR